MASRVQEEGGVAAGFRWCRQWPVECGKKVERPLVSGGADDGRLSAGRRREKRMAGSSNGRLFQVVPGSGRQQQLQVDWLAAAGSRDK
ncbi:hypothetical protein MRB53_002169 [Persea americana]|uniref:Uncharacterized protein n=1 Tax=Persea americana TaxID=3435 RepID=A0ACC2MUM7_PERAE|nr:hypothetical protein MRB53_002169 [Persea americana]